MYYSNVLTTSRGAVRGTTAIKFLGGATTPTIITGRGFSISGINTTTYTLYFPERYGTTAMTLLDCSFVSGTTSGVGAYTDPVISSGYSLPTVANQSSCVALQVWGWTTGAAITNPIGTLYFEFDAELGM